MSLRYTDQPTATNGSGDFVIRQRPPTIAQLCVIFFCALVVSVTISMAIVNRELLIALLFIILGLAGLFVILQTQRNRDLLLTTEFQNALFASALGINNKFCLIIRRDGNVVYVDRSSQTLFPEFLKQPKRTIDTLLEQGRVIQEDRKKIAAAIEEGVYDKVIFNIRANGGEYLKIVMSIEPILRPRGFILLRGREFIEQRSEAESAKSNMISKSSIALFSYVMDTLNTGVYMTDPSGSFIYVNPALEQWLSFEEGEITSSNLGLQDIVHGNGTYAELLKPNDYEGEVVLQKRVGGLIKCFINQKVIRDDQGKAIGCTALIHLLTNTQSEEAKKKLW